MGQTCVKSVDESSIRQPSLGAVATMVVGSFSMNSRNKLGSSGKANRLYSDDCRTTDQIETLRHTMNPTKRNVEKNKLSKQFRQFGPLCPPEKPMNSVVSCDEANRPGEVLLSGEDCSIALTNYETGHVLRRWVRAHHHDINAMSSMLPSETFATGSRDKTVKVWSVAKNKPLTTLSGHQLSVTSVDLYYDETLVASGSKDNTVRLWDCEMERQLFAAEASLNVVHFVRFVPALSCIAQGGEDRTVRLWDIRTGPHENDLSLSCTFSDMDYFPACCETVPHRPFTLLTGHNGCNGEGSHVGEWDLRMRRLLRTYSGHGGTVTSITMARCPSAYSSDTFFTSSDDRTIGTWPLETNPLCERVHQTLGRQVVVPEGIVTSLVSQRNGDVVATAANGSIIVFKPYGQDGFTVPAQRFRYIGVTE